MKKSIRILVVAAAIGAGVGTGFGIASAAPRGGDATRAPSPPSLTIIAR